jgi:Tol biopolymer transport system component
VSSESSRLAQQQLRVPATPVRAQLDRILASETFSRSERLSDFLRYVVEETLRGDGGGLKETVIGRELYRRGADFDAATDPIVRVDARRLRDKLREYYSESTNDPILITLPKGSYVPVFERNPTSVPLVHPFPKPEPAAALEPVRPAALRRTGWWFAAALVCIGTLAIGVWRLLPLESRAPARLIPLTTLPGNEDQPSLSPDGNFVAFTWNGSAEGSGSDIYVKAVDSEMLRRLTDTPESEASPAWSPDGREIAFVREANGVFLISVLGGPERKVLDSGTHVGWAADSKSVLVRDRCDDNKGACLYQVALETGDKRRLTRPPVGASDGRFHISPDGQTVAFVRGSASGASDLYTMPIAGGEPKRLTRWNTAFGGVAWTTDGRELIYSVLESAGFRLWRIAAGGVSTGNGVRVADAGEDATSPTLSRRGTSGPARLAYEKRTEDVSVRVVDLAAPRSGDIITATTLLADATFSRDCAVRMSPDGSEVAFSSLRSGEQLLWISRRDGSGLRKLTAMAAPEMAAGWWSPDGQRMVFDATIDGNRDIYVADTTGGQRKRLTDEPSADGIASWSGDGRWIYFVSNRSGGPQIWKVPADGGPAAQVTIAGGFDPQASPDGRFVYYLDRAPQYGSVALPANLVRIPADGGSPTVVLDNVRAFYWSVAEKGIFVLSMERDFDAVDVYDSATGKRARLGRLPWRVSRLCGRISISRNGRWLATNHVDRLDTNLMLVDNFR